MGLGPQNPTKKLIHSVDDLGHLPVISKLCFKRFWSWTPHPTPVDTPPYPLKDGLHAMQPVLKMQYEIKKLMPNLEFSKKLIRRQEVSKYNSEDQVTQIIKKCRRKCCLQISVHNMIICSNNEGRLNNANHSKNILNHIQKNNKGSLCETLCTFILYCNLL